MSENFKIGYGRESRKYAYSLEVQERKIVEQAQKNGDTIKHIYKERKSAFKNGNRTEFVKAMKDLENPNCTGIYFAKVDRSLRNLKDMMQLESFIGKKEMIFINGEFNLSTAQGRKSFRDACVNACHYSEDLSEKITDSQSEMLEDGYYPYTMPKYLDRENGVIKKNINTPIAETVFNMYLTGLYSDRSLAKRMNDLGYKQPNGKKLTKKNIAQILTNPLFTGLYKSKNGKTYKLNSEQVITRDFWEQIQDIRNNRDRRSGEKNLYPYSQLISYEKDKYLCGETAKGICYYKSVRTPEFFFFFLKGKKIRQAREEYIDQYVCNHIKSLNIGDSFYSSLRELYLAWGTNSVNELEKRRTEINKRITDIETKMVQAPIDHMDGKFSADILGRIMEKLQKDEKELKKSLVNMKGLDNEFLEITKNFLALVNIAKSNFESLNHEVRRSLFELFFEEAYVRQGMLYFKHTTYLEGLLELSKNEVFEPKKAFDTKASEDFVSKYNFWRRDGFAIRTFIQKINDISNTYNQSKVLVKIEAIHWNIKKSEEVKYVS